MSQSCSACEVNWWSYHAKHERCPMCGASTVSTDAPASDDADLLYRIAHAEAAKRDLYAHFDRYYAGIIGSGSGYPTADEARRDLRTYDQATGYAFWSR